MQPFRGIANHWIVNFRSLSVLNQNSTSRWPCDGLENYFIDLHEDVKKTVNAMSSCEHQTQTSFSPLSTKLNTKNTENRPKLCDNVNTYFLELKGWKDEQKHVLEKRTGQDTTSSTRCYHTSFLSESNERLGSAWFGSTPPRPTSARKENMQHTFLSTGVAAKLSDSAKNKTENSNSKDAEEKQDPSLEVLASSSAPSLKTINVMPGKGPPPEPPVNCCMSGCVNCVWIVYAEELKNYYSDGGKAALEAIEKIENSSLKAFLKLELDL